MLSVVCPLARSWQMEFYFLEWEQMVCMEFFACVILLDKILAWIASVMCRVVCITNVP